jgi:hypothetical protein
MTSCPLYNNNLDGTGGKMNNPYALIQRAGRKTPKKILKSKKIQNRRKQTLKKKKRVRFAKNVV